MLAITAGLPPVTMRPVTKPMAPMLTPAHIAATADRCHGLMRAYTFTARDNSLLTRTISDQLPELVLGYAPASALPVAAPAPQAPQI